MRRYKTIFHLDLDAFFVSVERILNPSLIGKAVIVGADPKLGRGVVSTCSYEARKYGVHSAMPIQQAYKLCPNGIFVRGTMTEYSKYSKSVKSILEEFAPVIEQASVDEFYMDFSGTHNIYGSMYKLGKKLQNEILEKLNLPSSIGIGTNKTIAKICSDYAKPQGIVYVPPGTEKEFLASLPVEVIPGVGKVMLKSLRSRGINRIQDVTALNEEYFSLAYGKAGISLWEKANGGGSTKFNFGRRQVSISKERTFGIDEIDKEKIENTIFKLTGKIAQTLRDKNMEAATVSIKLRYSDFVTITKAKTISPTNDDKIIFETALKLFRISYKRRVAVRLIGIHLTKFSEYNKQGFLFDETEENRKKMLKAVTSIRDKFGFEAIKLGESSVK